MNLKDTLCLFHTDMPIRVSAKNLDSQFFLLEENEKINKKIFKKYKGKKKYTLHDGPPYANGPIHLGHAYNKIMKDICIRSHFMMEYDAYTIPGFDCHGLPIEHKIISNNNYLSREEIITACRDYASKWIDNQTESFKKIGILMDFDNPYITMNPKYQSDIVRCFGNLVKKGYISRAKKTIPWCCGCQTTLASAEIEYQNRKDPSIYVLFEIEKKFNQEINLDKNIPISFIIWTTTPWTLPLNRGVMIKKEEEYAILKYEEQLFIIGKNCIPHFTEVTKKNYQIIQYILSETLKPYLVHHPFEENNFVPIILDDSVNTTEGTACVHTAPGCGPIDYEIGIKNNLEIYSPISKDGKYTEDCIIQELHHKKISESQGWIISELEKKSKLWHKGSINHSYPHCWRSKEGLIFRATFQWFCNLEKNNLKEKVLNTIENIDFYPSNTAAFLKATVSNRWEWCISRQRVWGVPIIAFINKIDNNYWTSTEFIKYIAEKIKIHGIEYWNSVPFEDLKPIIPTFIDENNWQKETDILDVWFDSGISHEAVLSPLNRFPADIYLEGTDQHRGWFQSSLLTSIALHDEIAPMKGIISCGYTVDEKGQKMSKSLGNVVTPEEVVELIGLDGLRLWVSSIMLGGDITIGKKIFENIQEVHRKIRNTARFGVQNIADFNPKTDMVNYDTLGYINQLVLKRMFQYQIIIINAYQTYNFPKIFHTFIEIANTFLSSFYFDAAKDILYCDNQNSLKRRQIQTTIYIILEALTRLIAPILKNTAEEISSYYFSEKRDSIHLESFYSFDIFKNSNNIEDVYQFIHENPFYIENTEKKLKKLQNTNSNDVDLILISDNNFLKILKLRELTFKATEELRQEGIIKQSTEASICLTLPLNEEDSLKGYHDLIKILNLTKTEAYSSVEEILCDYLMVSEVKIIQTNNFSIKAIKHSGEKCERCWKYFYANKIVNNISTMILCKRCIDIVKNFIKVI